jgi:hypothetical protein
MSHESCQFTDARAGAWTVWVSHHNQRGAVSLKTNPTLDGPLAWSHGRAARSILITPQDGQSDSDSEEPQSRTGDKNQAHSFGARRTHPDAFWCTGRFEDFHGVF